MQELCLEGLVIEEI